MKRFEQSGDREINRPQELRGIDEHIPKQTGNTEADQLRGERDEDTSRTTRVAAVEELLGGQCLRGRCGLRGGRSHDCDCGMLLLVERAGVEETEETPARDDEGHEFAEDVGDHAQEDDGDEDGLGLEVEDFLEDGAEDGEAGAWVEGISIASAVWR